MTEQRYPATATGKEMYRLAEAVSVKLEPDGGGPFVDVAVLAVEMVRQSIIEIEAEAALGVNDLRRSARRNTTHECPICGHVHLPIEPATTPEASDSPEKPT